MVRIDRVSTRSGDDGSTGLGDGRRQPKDDVLIAALGSVDEANSWLGLIRSEGLPPALDAVAERIQQDLFDVGADLCCPPGTAIGERVHRIGDLELGRLDAWLAEQNAALPALSSFVLPGGHRMAAQWHVLRTVARRAERDVISAHRRADPAVNPQCIRYLNRFSDLCFVLARRANDDGRGDVLWVPART